MKTPRELLFEHHKNAQPDLDQIRRDVLKKAAGEAEAQQNRFWGLPWILSALRSPSGRFQIAGLAAAWVAILALNVTSGHDSAIAPAIARVGPGHTVSLAWREYCRQLSEALESQPAVAAAKPDQRSLLLPVNPKPMSNV
jgi:hypothetical protein